MFGLHNHRYPTVPQRFPESGTYTTAKEGGTVTAHCAALFFYSTPSKAILRPCERPWASDVSFYTPERPETLKRPLQGLWTPFYP